MPDVRSSRLLLPLFALLVTTPRVAETALVSLSLEQLTARSGFVVRGEVLDVKSRWGALGGHGRVLLTDVRIRVSEVWKDTPGHRPEILRRRSEGGTTAAHAKIEEITVQYLGGVIGQRWQLCPESPRYEKGEQVLVFARVLQGRLWTTGWMQGKYRVGHQRSAGRTVAVVAGDPRLPVHTTQPLSDLRARVRAIVARRETPKTSARAASPDRASRNGKKKRTEVRR